MGERRRPRRLPRRQERDRRRALRALALLLLFTVTASAPPPALRPVLWAWERAEDLRFAGPEFDVAVMAGTVTLRGAGIGVIPRRQPTLVGPGQHLIGVAHIEVDRATTLAGTPPQVAAAAQAALDLVRDPRFTEMQVDFEVRRSERPVLLALLAAIRAGLPPGRRLSMTALASWCDTERWLAAAPVDQVVPMLFRMGKGGAGLQARLAAGGDLGDPACRTALGIATDSKLPLVPTGRRMFFFNPHAWSATDLPSNGMPTP